MSTKTGYSDQAKKLISLESTIRRVRHDLLDEAIVIIGVLKRSETREVSIENKRLDAAGCIFICVFVWRYGDNPFIS